MSGRSGVLAALLTCSACLAYTGGARALDPAQLVNEPGWIVAGATPALRQRSTYDCGAAALAMVAERWNVALSTEAAAAALPTLTPAGVQLGDLRDVARAHHLLAYAIAGTRDTLTHELTAGRPVIVGLALPYGARHVAYHFEVVVATRIATDQFATIDPATGWRVRTWSQLDAEWRVVGRPALVLLGPAPSPIAVTVATTGSAASSASPRR